jgi:hypothetical protein
MIILLTPTFLVPFATVHAVTDPTGWYTTVNGVLTSDYYTLYPYTQKSIDLGFSKYGELINSTKGGSIPSDPTTRGVGLQYPGYDAVGTYDQRITGASTSRDPFANELVTKNLWVNGWLINITYRNRIFEETGLPAYRVVWAFALFSDGIKYGGEWQNHSMTPTIGAGGRQTNKLAVTDPIQVLYDGPREYIALLTTHLFDEQAVVGGTLTWPVADVMFTMLFNKVKKEVVIFKEVKILLETKYLEGLVNVQLGNRGEWDLGPTSGPLKLKSYAEFYPSAKSMGLNTPYGWEWADYNGTGTSQTMLLRDLVEHYVATAGQADFPTQNPIWDSSEAVFVNGLYQLPGINRDYIITGGDTIHFNRYGGLNAGDKVLIQYKWAFQDWTKDYSVAQVISADNTFVGAAAFWPQLSDWTVDGWNRRLTALFNVQEPTMSSEPGIPFVAGEWDFAIDTGQQWRSVETYVLTDLHDGAVNPQGKTALIDKEVKYQLDEVYNPWDLLQAIHKKDRRWVEFKDSYVGGITLKWTPFLLAAQWDAYNTFAEKVIDEDTGMLLVRNVDYYISYNPNTGVATIVGISSAFYYDYIKIEYSTATTWDGPSTAIQEEVFSESNELLPGQGTQEFYTNSHSVNSGDLTDALGATWSLGTPSFGVTLSNNSDLKNKDYTLTVQMLSSEVEYIKVFKGETADLDPYEGTLTGSFIISALNGTWTLSEPDAEIEAPALDDLHVYSANMIWDFTVHFESNTTRYNMTISVEVSSGDGPMYCEGIGGRYEWIVVGRDALTVDSAGAAMIAASMRDKQIQIGIAGEDMLSKAETWSNFGYLDNLIPSVMHQFTTTEAGMTTMADYKDSKFRAALVDDWCTYWPVTTSDMIGVGGLYANMLSYYANDFTNAFFGNPQFTPNAVIPGVAGNNWFNSIAGIPCWSKNSYSDTETEGYAVISTYLDINGTIVFEVWGLLGRDTYYVSQWLHGDVARGIMPGVFYLQGLNPGTTSLILHIDYSDAKHPTFNIVENLGTISEKEPLHPDP